MLFFNNTNLVCLDGIARLWQKLFQELLYSPGKTRMNQEERLGSRMIKNYCQSHTHSIHQMLFSTSSHHVFTEFNVLDPKFDVSLERLV